MKLDSKLLLLICGSQIPLGLTWSQESDDREAISCVALSRIDRTEVIDDQNIAFHMRGGDIYVNQLDRACPRLSRERRFSYRTATRQLCSSDLITIIENSGLGLRDGLTCGLGLFVPADEESLALLKGDEEPAEIKVEDIEIEAEEAEEEAE